MTDVFDLLDTPEDAAILRQKSALYRRIVVAHRDSGETQVALSVRLRVPPSRVCTLLRGYLDLFSLEMLQRFCIRMGLAHL